MIMEFANWDYTPSKADQDWIDQILDEEAEWLIQPSLH